MKGEKEGGNPQITKETIPDQNVNSNDIGNGQVNTNSNNSTGGGNDNTNSNNTNSNNPAPNNNSNNPGPSSSDSAVEGDPGGNVEGGMAPIEVITTPPQEDMYGDQSQAVPPAAATAQEPAVDNEDAASNVSSSLVAYQFKQFNKESYQRLHEREAEFKRKAQEKKDRPSEGRLVDGELVYDGEEGDEPPLDRDPNLVEGNTLPEHMEQDFPKELFSTPIEEIDSLIKDKTFVVITKRFKKTHIHRFSATKAFFLLAPWNPLRRAAIYVATSQAFDYFIILTILTNCIFLALPEYPFVEDAENVWLAIYTVEAVVKLTARGFFLNSNTYLRDPWNWLDFIIILSAYVTLVLGNQQGILDSIRPFRVFRAIKTISIVPGLKTIVGALLKSMRMLAEVILLTLFVMMVFSLFTLQVYVGILRQKCVLKIPDDVQPSHYEYSLHLKNESNWLSDGESFLICGNSTGARQCPNTHTCLPDIGPNPNFGYTSFDNIGWALLTSFQLITLDFWEDTYNKVIEANGPLNIIFFAVVIFFGSFYLINLMLAVVSMSYEEEALQAGKWIAMEKEKERKREKRERKERKEKERKERAAAAAAAAATESAAAAAAAEENSPIPRRSSIAVGGGGGQQGTNNNESSTSDTNHLQLVGGNMNGSNSASNVSLNGHLPAVVDLPGMKSPAKNSVKKEVDSKAGKGGLGGHKTDLQGGPGVDHGGDEKRPTASTEHLVKSDLDGSTKLGHQNPIVEDDHSIISIDNQGDAPDVIIKDDEEELVDRNCQCCPRCCHGYPNWLAFQNFFYKVVTDIIFELFISFCITINVLAMAIEHYDMDPAFLKTLDDMNLVFTIIFTLEAFIKLLAMSKDFFTSAWNIFDLFVVGVSFADLFSGSLGSLKVIRLVRLLRVFRLAQTWSTMRVLISIIFRTLGAMGNLILILILVIYICAVFGMQVFGKSYTPDKFYPDDVPRWNFNDFGHAILLVFRVLCGEWIEPLWDCMRAAGETCMIVFFPTLVLGNFVVLNLFLALMLNSFATDSLNKGKDELKEDKMKEGWNKLKGLFKPKGSAVEPHEGMESKKPSIADIVEELKRHQKAVYEGDEEEESRSVKSARSKLSIVDEDNRVKEIELNTFNDDSHLEDEATENAKNMTKNNMNPSNGVIKSRKSKDISKAFQTDRTEFSEFSTAMTVSSKKKDLEEDHDNIAADDTPAKGGWGAIKGKDKDKKAADKKKEKGKDEESDEEEKEGDGKVQDCLPAFCFSCACCECYHHMDENSCGRGWTRFREIIHKMTETKVFEYFIVIVILASSITLCFEDIWIYRNNELKDVLKILNIIFAAIFVAEMVFKWIALGFKTYFTSFWTVLDFFIVIITLLTLASESLGLEQVSAFRGLRTLRALRPLRAVSRWQGMKIVVNALLFAIPAICNVLMVCAIFWLLFAIGGYQFFGGRFRKCVDADGARLAHTLVPDKHTCLEFQANGTGYSWVNSKINFDNVWAGYLALLQVATFEGWMEVMEDAVDMTSFDQQPYDEATFSSYWFFVIFILVGSFFSLNLFIGVIIENFNSLKKKYEGGYVDIFLTASQKNYYNTMKKLGNRKPQKTIKRPKNKIQGFFFDVAVSTKFELAIVLLILVNMAAMAMERYHQSAAYTDALDIINIIFTTIFTLEAIVKIIGLRWHYFRRMWNVFDLIIVILSIIGVVLDDLLRDIFITPTLLRVVRVFRIGRVLRLVKAAKGIRKLLFALVISIPALLNIGMLLFILMFMYAILGMSLFGEVRHRDALNDVTNFETFFNSFVLLFRLTTAAGWNDILEPLMEEHDCNRTHRIMPDGDVKKIEGGDCGNAIGGALYMSSYVIFTYLIIINMYIAVILENFNQAHEQEEVGITEDDFEMFYVVWERYDPHATQFIKVEYLSDLVADLDLPLGIPKPNEIALVAFDLPIMEGERLHCLDVLTSLVKHVLGGVEDTEEFRNLKTQMEERYRSAFPTRVTQIQISSTMKRKKEDVAAKTLQRAWRKHKAQQSIRKITSMAMEAKLNKSLSRTSFSGASSSSPHPDRPSSSTSSTTSIKVVPSPNKKLGNTLTVPSTERA